MASRSPLSSTQVTAVIPVLARFALRDQLLIMLGLRTGFRISELLSLNIADVVTVDGIVTDLTVSRRWMKNGRGVRLRRISSRRVPLVLAARQLLSAYVAFRQARGARGCDPLFLSTRRRGRLSRWQANRIVHRVFTAAGVPATLAIGTPSMRKTFARSVCETTGHDLNLTRHVLGHRHADTTLRYFSIEEDQARAAVLAIARPRPQFETASFAIIPKETLAGQRRMPRCGPKGH